MGRSNKELIIEREEYSSWSFKEVSKSFENGLQVEEIWNNPTLQLLLQASSP